MSEIQFHPGNPRRKTRLIQIGTIPGTLIATFTVGAGTLIAAGLLGAPDLISDLVRSADKLSLRETTRRGAEAFATVGRRYIRVAGRLAVDELFLARVAVIADVRLPPGFPGDSPAGPPDSPSATEVEVLALARRLRIFESFRRRIASLPLAPSGPDPRHIPSRSPVDPSSTVPVARYGPEVSPVTRDEEFFPGLALACPAGTTVVAPADGTVLFAGPPGRRAHALWRRLGLVLVLSHDERVRTLYGHLQKILVRRGQRVVRGDPIALVGESGFSTAPRLHYEVLRLMDSSFRPLDPRLFILDTDWITAAEVRSPLPPPAGEGPTIP